VEGKLIDDNHKYEKPPSIKQASDKIVDGEYPGAEREKHKNIEAQDENDERAAHYGLRRASNCFRPTGKPEGQDYDWYDNDVSDCIHCVSRKTSLYELVFIEWIEKIQALIVYDGEYSKPKILSICFFEKVIVG